MKQNISIRKVRENDLSKIRELVNSCKPLGFHTLYTYWVIFHYFGDYCFVAESEGRLIGFVTGIVTNESKRCGLIWQVGVNPKYRKTGLAKKLLSRISNEFYISKITRLQFTIEEDNFASNHTFSSFASRNKLEMKRIGSMSINDMYSDHKEEENIFEIELNGLTRP